MNLELMKKIDVKKLSPMMKQWYDIKMQHTDALILFRLGDFYELFYDDALEASRVLEITLTHKDCGQEEKAVMCGVPHHSVDTYLAKLLQQNYKVGICEQVEDPSQSKGLVKRELVRFVTPGTLTELNSLEEKKNNFLMSLASCQGQSAIAVADLSTGFFQLGLLGEDKDGQKILSEIRVFSPSELILSTTWKDSKKEFLTALKEDGYFLSFIEEKNFTDLTKKKVFQENTSLWTYTFEEKKEEVFTLEAFTLEDVRQKKAAELALQSLHDYILETQKQFPSFLKHLHIYQYKAYLQVHPNARQSLELETSLRQGNKKASLLGHLDICQTAMGSRYLRSLFFHISMDKQEIYRRYELIACFLRDYARRQEARKKLRTLYDIERLASKLASGQINPRELLSLASTLEKLPAFLAHFRQESIFSHLSFYSDEKILGFSQPLLAALKNPAPTQMKEGGIFETTYHPQLAEYYHYAHSGKESMLALESTCREKYQMKHLKIGYNRVYGYYFEVSKSALAQVPTHFVRKQTLVNAERYICEELKELEDKVLGAQSKLLNLEIQLYQELREACMKEAAWILALAKELAEMDCFLALAERSEEFHYIRPSLLDEPKLTLKKARHPVVEAKNFSQFVANDVHLDGNHEKLLLLTGPNMAGKSTYMRQIALIVIMAQIGCYVPCEEAEIGLCDQIFTRIGAADDLSSGQSTFMLEMKETADIINNMTSRSLILLDEVGRGTSTYDGLSIASSLLEYFCKTSLPLRTLFATHYHELVQLAEELPQAKNYHIEVRKEKNTMVFLHQILEGGSDDSFGIEVAQLAGLPKSVLKRAKQVLKYLEWKKKETTQTSPTLEGQVDLFSFLNQEKEAKFLETLGIPASGDDRDEVSSRSYEQFIEEDKLRQRIQQIDVNRCSPMQALQELLALQEYIATEKHKLEE